MLHKTRIHSSHVPTTFSCTFQHSPIAIAIYGYSYIPESVSVPQVLGDLAIDGFDSDIILIYGEV